MSIGSWLNVGKNTQEEEVWQQLDEDDDWILERAGNHVYPYSQDRI